MRTPPLAMMGFMLTVGALTHAANLNTAAQPAPLCSDNQYSGPALLLDLSLYKEDHPGTRVIDYGVRLPPGEFQRPLRVECRVLPNTAPVAQWIARPPPKGQVAGSIPARGTNSDSAVASNAQTHH